MQSAETATILVCRCGWVAVTGSFGEAADMRDEEGHGFDQPGHLTMQVLAMSAPIPDNGVVEAIVRQAHVAATEARAMDFLENWKLAPKPVRLYGSRLGALHLFGRLAALFMGGPSKLHYGGEQ